MSILDTFLIVFDGDASKAKLALAGVTQASEQTAAKVVADHERTVEATLNSTAHTTKLGEAFAVVGDRAAEMGKKVVEHLAEIAAGFAALLGVEKLVERFFEQAETSQRLGEQAKQLGLNVTMLDAWGQAVRREGGTADGFVQSVQTLTLSLQRMAIGAPLRGKRFFEALGITDPQHELNNIFELFPKLAEKVKDMPKAQSFAMLRGIGLDEATIRILQAGGKEVEELIARQKMLGNITQEDTEIAKKFNVEWMDVKQVLRGAMIEADTTFLPILGRMLKYVEEFILFLREHKDLVVGFFYGLGAAIAVATLAMWRLNIAFLSNPITWIIIGIGLLIAAFAFLYDDIKAFTAGHNSAIGEMMKRYPLFKTAIEDIIFAYKKVMETLDFFKLKNDEILNYLDTHWGKFGQILKTIVETLEKIVQLNPVDLLLGGGTTDIKEGGSAAWDWIKGKFTGGGNGNSGPDTSSSAEHDATAKRIHDKFVAKGMDDATAWGFAARAIRESGGIANRDEMGGGPGQGLWQITSADRKADYHATYGHAPDQGSEDEQIDFVLHELKGSQAAFWNRIQHSADGAGAKGAAVSRFYDRPADVNGEALKTGQYAEYLANLNAGKGILNSTKTPLMAQTSSSLSTRNSTNTNSLLMSGDVHLHSGTDDPKSFTDTFLDHLSEHYNGLMPNYADGVQY
jgi:hypothetical protein